MQPLVDSLHLIATRRDSRFVIIISTVLFLVLLLIVQNGIASVDMLSLTSFSFLKRLSLSLAVLFDITSTFTAGTLILATLGSFLGGINIALAYTYIKVRGDMILKSGLYSGVGLILAFLGIGCAACGTALLSVVFGFFGFSAMLNLLPYQGQEIGYIGLIILCMATYTLAKKVASPNVC
jgi:hypothetical protein